MTTVKKPTRTNKATKGIEDNIKRAASAAEIADEKLTGASEIELDDTAATNDLVRNIARKINTVNTRLTGNNTLEILSRLKQDSLLSTPVVQNGVPITDAQSDAGRTLKDALDKVEATMINELFQSEKGRLEDYQTYHQIKDLITQASEAIGVFTDNIISPDDFTKRDLNVFYEGDDDNGELLKIVKKRCNDLITKYNLEDKCEDAITNSLTKGDFFIAAFNTRQELESILHEDVTKPSMLIEAVDVPSLDDPIVNQLVEYVRSECKENNTEFNENDLSNLRTEIATYLNSLMALNEDASKIVSNTSLSMDFAKDIPSRRNKKRSITDDKFVNNTKVSLAGSKIVGSVLKLIPPENVIKLYQDDVIFGYYFVELTGPDIADFARKGNMDQTAVVRAIDQNLSIRSLGGSSSFIQQGKEALISKLITKTLSAKLDSSKFLKDNEEFAADAYWILTRARRERKRATFTYVAPDQMIHFSPTGATGYGTSVLNGVKFMAKLYIGAMTNAFMRNSIRRPERLVWYIDTGMDNDGNNAVQNVIRTIKQREVKFSNLRDITTTINQIGEFHDFYIPTYNGERPVEVETLNMGAAAEVDSPFLEYLRKAIIGGMGVPAAFVGYSEEVAFARSLTMDNGRLLRRVVRLQKHYGKASTKLIQTLYRNEYLSLEEIYSGLKDDDIDKPTGKNKEKTAEQLKEARIEIDKIVVRYPSPATLNMQNLADAINQGQPVSDFITETIAVGEDDDVKGELKKLILKDIMPQIHWDKYADFFEEAKRVVQKKKAIDSTASENAPPQENPDDLNNPDDNQNTQNQDQGDDSFPTENF
jgi:hypothetical protein